jgi:hypothetical protein
VVAAVRAPLAAPPCPGCAGGGEVNGLDCRECGGRGRVRGKVRREWRLLLRSRPVLAAAAAAGTVVGWSRTVPGVGGAAAVTYGVAVTVHGVFRQVPALGVAALVAGAFGLLADRRL